MRYRPRPNSTTRKVLKQDNKVEKETEIFDVVEIVLEFFPGVLDGGAVGVEDLGPSGEAGFDGVAGVVEGDFPL